MIGILLDFWEVYQLFLLFFLLIECPGFLFGLVIHWFFNFLYLKHILDVVIDWLLLLYVQFILILYSNISVVLGNWFIKDMFFWPFKSSLTLHHLVFLWSWMLEYVLFWLKSLSSIFIMLKINIVKGIVIQKTLQLFPLPKPLLAIFPGFRIINILDLLTSIRKTHHFWIGSDLF